MNKESWGLVTKIPVPYERINILHRGPYQIKMHSHPYWQMIVVTSGCLHVTTMQKDTAMYAGTVHILPPNVNHALYSPEGYSQLGIDLQISDHPLIPLLHEQFPEPVILASEQLLSLAITIDELYQLASPLATAQMWNRLETLILHCIETAASSLQNHWRDELLSYINDNLHLPLKLLDIAEHFFISIPQLERRCRSFFHCGVFSLLQQQRFRKAQQLLLGTEQSIQEIGTAGGYPDAAHFSDFFKKHAGVSPRMYRNQSRLYA